MEAREQASRGRHARVIPLLLVAAGGMLGTLAREGLTLGLGPMAGSAAVLFAVNTLGSLLLGLLLGGELRGRGVPVRARLFVGTGVLGGFTSYSALAGVIGGELGTGDQLQAVLFGGGSVAAGLLAAGLGALLVRSRRGQR